ncbi:hypothetical protein GCM10007086_18750 [Photobacterium aphoticum]|nr:hypothetical protein GCM10007086_18750 [Photobacterium aphoticum]
MDIDGFCGCDVNRAIGTTIGAPLATNRQRGNGVLVIDVDSRIKSLDEIERGFRDITVYPVF